MREIKFRAWNDKSKEMFDVDVLAINPVMWDSGGTGVSLAYQPHIKIMQYTGLRDSKRTKEYPNGQEIYEGDIVKYKDCGKEHMSQIIQDFSLGTGHYVRCPGLGFYTINESTIVMLEIEVIGNIYENPELLECEE